MRYLYIAEKPSSMKAVKEAYEKSSKKLGEIKFMALSGHVCRLMLPKEYDEWDVPWKDRKLPMVPSVFKVDEIKASAQKIANIRAELEKNEYDGIIVGTDSDVEGNGIYDLLCTYLGLQNYKTYRFFETDLTDAEIMKSFNNLTDFYKNPRDVGMTQAYRIRSRFDWLIGFNLSTACTIKAGSLMKVGRVKAPTLKLVYDNCKEIDNFVPSTNYQPCITTKDPEITAMLIGDDKKAQSFKTKKEAEDFLASLDDKAAVKSFEKKQKSTPPEQLFKLSDIQVEAGRKYGYTPSQTLEAIQSLYETYKVVSYPRTDGRYISTEKAKELETLLSAVKKTPGLSDYAKKVSSADIERVSKDKRFVNDDEVKKASHCALIPTGNAPDFSEMKKIEKDICLMIFRRFLSIFFPPLIESKTKCVLEDSGHLFLANGSEVVSPGFKVLYDIPKDTPLPEIKKGDILTVAKRGVHEITSTRPPRLTQATLIKAMENIQKYLSGDDAEDKEESDEYKAILKKTGGIGQPSSRAAIIDDLISAGYMEDKRGLYITPLGKAYIENLNGSSIISPALTAKWEMHMEDIQHGDDTYDNVYPQIIEYLNASLSEIEKMNFKRASADNFEAKCPVCGGRVIKRKYGYECENHPDKCTLAFSNHVASNTMNISDKDAMALLKGETVGPLKGMKKKDGTPFSAKVVLKENGTLTWASGKTKTEFKCPKCGRFLWEYPNRFSCSGYPDCTFALWKRPSGWTKDMAKTQAKKLLDGETLKGIPVKWKDGRETTADFKLDKDYDYKLRIASGKPEPKKIGLKCPLCGKDLLDRGNFYGCSGFPGCKASAPKKKRNGDDYTKDEILDFIRNNKK